MQDSFAVGISLPKYLIKKIDDARGDVPRSRYVLRMLEKTCLLERAGDGIKSSRDQDSLENRFEMMQSSESYST